MYDVESLKSGIEQCRKNIKTFEDAILREEETIKQYRDHMKHIQEKAAIQQEARARIEVVRE